MKPNIDQFKKYVLQANVIPVYAEVLADMETPVSVFSKIEQAQTSFLLESAEKIGKWGRYSFIGHSPKAIFSLRGRKSELRFGNGNVVKSSSGDNLVPLAPLREYLASRRIMRIPELPDFVGGAVGYFGYECIGLFEKMPEPKTSPEMDDAFFGIYDDIIIFDNIKHTAKIVACANIDEFADVESAYANACERIEKNIELFRKPRNAKLNCREIGEIKFQSNVGREEFCAMVEKCKDYIMQGEAIQIVPSRKFFTTVPIDALSAYRALRMINPSPYMFCLKMGNAHLVGSSPETLIRFCDGKANVRPIAGTRRRGKDENEDMALASELLSNEKERAEHLMLVDLGRNDISKFCEAGSVQVGDFMSIERYSHVMHLVSDISGEVMKGKDAFDALAAVFPAGTLSGAPKIRAMQVINELEPECRGCYGGAVGYIGYGGNMDMAITIRSLQMCNGITSIQAGAGIVFDSDAELEYEETRIKSEAVARAIESACKLERIDFTEFERK